MESPFRAGRSIATASPLTRSARATDSRSSPMPTGASGWSHAPPTKPGTSTSTGTASAGPRSTVSPLPLRPWIAPGSADDQPVGQPRDGLAQPRRDAPGDPARVDVGRRHRLDDVALSDRGDACVRAHVGGGAAATVEADRLRLPFRHAAAGGGSLDDRGGDDPGAEGGHA